jgi:hypothetical protein
MSKKQNKTTEISPIRAYYHRLFDKLHQINKQGDNEASHILQDKIYRKFIKDIVSGKIRDEEIKVIAQELNEYVVKNDYDRWYA